MNNRKREIVEPENGDKREKRNEKKKKLTKREKKDAIYKNKPMKIMKDKRGKKVLAGLKTEDEKKKR